MIPNALATWLVAASCATSPVPSVPTSLDLSVIRAIPVQHDGRWPPLDTVARDLVDSVTGTEFYGGRDPVLTLLAWTFDAQSWRQAPLYVIGNAELRRELHMPTDQTAFSFEELTSHRFLHSLVDDLSRVPKGQKLDPLQKKVRDLHEKLLVSQSIFSGRELSLIPNAEDAMGAWRPIPAASAVGGDGADALTGIWNEVASAFTADDASAFTAASRKLAEQLAAVPAARHVSEELLATELRYNALHPFRTAWQIMLAATILAVVALRIRRRWFDAAVVVALICGFAVLTYGLSLRWQIAGRIPASNMFESLLFLSWGMGIFAIVSMFVFEHRMVPLTALGMGATALILADVLPLDHFIRPIAPVLLDTVWMSIHVPVIMVSYSVLALAVLIAHVQLIVMALAPSREALVRTVDGLHYWYVHVGTILLTAGIITGSMWAASSWGRYWGWDPKEVWSLVALLGYLTILHVRIDQQSVPRWAYIVGAVLCVAVFVLVAPRMAPLTGGRVLALAGALAGVVILVLAHGRFATAAKSILCFWLIIMTYVGVNFVLGSGLHSYGFGTGAVAHYMFLCGGIDLALVFVLSVIYVLRGGQARHALAVSAVS